MWRPPPQNIFNCNQCKVWHTQTKYSLLGKLLLTEQDVFESSVSVLCGFEIKNSTSLSGQLTRVGGWVEGGRGGGRTLFWATATCPGLLPPLNQADATLHRLLYSRRPGDSLGMAMEQDYSWTGCSTDLGQWDMVWGSRPDYCTHGKFQSFLSSQKMRMTWIGIPRDIFFAIFLKRDVDCVSVQKNIFLDMRARQVQ